MPPSFASPPVHLYWLYLICCSRNQGVLLALCLLVYLTACLLAYLLACIFALRIISVFKTTSFVRIIIHSKNTPLAEQCAGPLGFCNKLHSFKLGLQSSLFMCSHPVLSNLITCFLICFTQESHLSGPSSTPRTCGAQWKVKMWELFFKKQEKKVPSQVLKYKLFPFFCGLTLSLSLSWCF